MSKEIIEINGCKFEVDMSTAQQITEYKVGDVVKVLKKEYGNAYKSYAGTIVGFDAFVGRPTIIIAYLSDNYSSADIQFIYYNAKTEDVEICLANENDLVFSKDTVVEKMNRDIAKKHAEIEEIEQKRDFFIKNFAKCFISAS